MYRSLHNKIEVIWKGGSIQIFNRYPRGKSAYWLTDNEYREVEPRRRVDEVLRTALREIPLS